MAGKATPNSPGGNTPGTEEGTSVLNDVKAFLAEHNDASALVRQAQRFSINLPVIGKARVPPPKQLAFYGVLGALAAAGAIEWPVAVALGLGVAVTQRAPGPAVLEQPKALPAKAFEEALAEDAAAPDPAPEPVPAPATKKAPAKKTAAKKTASKAAAAKKTPAKKAPAKRAATKVTPTAESTSKTPADTPVTEQKTAPEQE